jgi:beta-N-acetylhexosaminidase
VSPGRATVKSARTPGGGGRPGRRLRRLALLVVALAVIIAALGLAVHDGTSGRAKGRQAAALRPSVSPAPPDPTATPRPASHPTVDVEAILAKMTLREKVGQLFMTYAYGASATDSDPSMVAANRRLAGVDNAAGLVRRYHLGGVLLLGRNTLNDSGLATHNVQGPSQIARYCNGLQKAARGRSASIPLLIATDQEQGLVTRIGPPATQFPGNMALGADGRVDDTFAAAQITAEELRAMGVSMDLAPVADVNIDPRNPVIGVRSFGSDPRTVAALTAGAVKGYLAGGVAPCVKHFPGHGATSVDSHYALPVVRQSLSQIEKVDLPPFEAAITAGAPAVMIAHLDVPALDDSGRPASLSHAVITGLLRHRLGFRGVVITDSLWMSGVRVAYSDAEIPVLAIRAGVDIVLMPPDIDLAYRAVLGAVRSGSISRSRLDASVRRILQLKADVGLFEGARVDPRRIKGIVGTWRHRATARAITRRSITLLTTRPGLLPLKKGEDVLVTGVDAAATAELERRLNELGATAHACRPGPRPGSQAAGTAAALSRASRVTVVTTIAAVRDSGQRALVRALVRAGRPVVIVALGVPYGVAALPGADAYLAAYNARAGSVDAVAEVLMGRATAGGALPVPIARSGSRRPLFPLGFKLGGASAD